MKSNDQWKKWIFDKQNKQRKVISTHNPFFSRFFIIVHVLIITWNLIPRYIFKFCSFSGSFSSQFLFNFCCFPTVWMNKKTSFKNFHTQWLIWLKEIVFVLWIKSKKTNERSLLLLKIRKSLTSLRKKSTALKYIRDFFFCWYVYLYLHTCS